MREKNDFKKRKRSLEEKEVRRSSADHTEERDHVKLPVFGVIM